MTTYDRGFVDVMRDNAIPITLIGIGTAWLLASTTGVADRVANDDRVHAARRISELAGNAGLTSGTREPRGGSILGPDGKPLSRAGEDYEDSWVHKAAGATKNVITSVRDAGSAVLDRGRGVQASSPAGRAIRLAISCRPIPGSSVSPAWLPVRSWQRCYHLPGSSRTTLGRRVTTS